MATEKMYRVVSKERGAMVSALSYHEAAAQFSGVPIRQLVTMLFCGGEVFMVRDKDLKETSSMIVVWAVREEPRI